MQDLGAAPHIGRKVEALVLDALAKPRHVASGREGAALAGDDQAAQRRAVGEPGERDRHLADHLRAHRVERVGPGEGQRADLAVDLDPHRLELRRARCLACVGRSPSVAPSLDRGSRSLTFQGNAEAAAQARRTAQTAARPAGRLPVRRRARPGDLRRQGAIDPQARQLALLARRRPWSRRPPRRRRLDRLPRHRDRGRGAARRAAVHQAPPPDLQHQAARRQVLSLRRDQPRRGVPARLLHARAPPARPRLLRALLERAPGARDARPARQGLPVPDLRRPGAGAALRRSVPRLLHQALPGALRRLHRPGRVPAQHRGDHGLPLGPLPRHRARPRARHGGRVGGAAVRARRDPARSPRRRALAARAPARRRAIRSAPPT